MSIRNRESNLPTKTSKLFIVLHSLAHVKIPNAIRLINYFYSLSATPHIDSIHNTKIFFHDVKYSIEHITQYNRMLFICPELYMLILTLIF